MATGELENYRYRGARALVLLHEREMRKLLPIWLRAVREGVKLPATEDPDYASLQALLLHALRSARGYLIWICEKLGLPDPGIDPPPDAERVEADTERYLDHLFERWRLPLADVPEPRFSEVCRTRWGWELPIEGMLEHAMAHPMRHAFQLEELLDAQGAPGPRIR